jgi:hypothetical protein
MSEFTLSSSSLWKQNGLRTIKEYLRLPMLLSFWQRQGMESTGNLGRSYGFLWEIQIEVSRICCCKKWLLWQRLWRADAPAYLGNMSLGRAL